MDKRITLIINKYLNVLFVTCLFLLPSKNLGQINSILKSNESDTKNDSLITVGSPEFYTDSHILVGAEIIDPLHPSDNLITITRLWKTDIRVGISQKFKYGIKAFLSFRDNDSPYTNNVNLYETGIKIKRDWGRLWFGQRRIQSGNKSFYLNDAFDRYFWDEGLIYDYLMRGAGISIKNGIGKADIFIGSDKSSYFLGGGKYSITFNDRFNTAVSGLYIARDKEYSAFGTELGIEAEHSSEHFWNYFVFGYKSLNQSPSKIEEYTFFFENRSYINNDVNIGGAFYFKRFKDKYRTQDDYKINVDIRYEINRYFTPVLSGEYFRTAGFNEYQIGFSAYLNYIRGISAVPRIRYIITEIGPDLVYIGLEVNYKFGNWE